MNATVVVEFEVGGRTIMATPLNEIPPRAIRSFVAQQLPDRIGNVNIHIVGGSAHPEIKFRLCGPSGGYVWFRGGMSFSDADAGNLHGLIARAVTRELERQVALGGFLAGMRDFARETVFPRPNALE